MDNPVFTSDADFKSYLRKNKMTLESYHYKFYPRLDLWDQKPIVFKNVDQYMTSFFNNRRNLVSYLKTTYKTNPSEAQKLVKTILRDRRNLKGLTKSMGQVELRSIIAPSVLFIQQLGLDYHTLNRELGLEIKFNYNDIKLPKVIPEDFVILQDTREQSPLKFKKIIKVIESKLDFGDYTAAGIYHENIFIERKSLADLLGTLSQGYERFRREMERAVAFDGYLVVVIETTFAKAMGFNYLPHIHSKATPEFIFSRMRELIKDFDNVQFLFVDGRPMASEMTETILLTGTEARYIDWQFIYDSKGAK